MAQVENTQLIERFQEFYREYYAEAIGELGQQYPTGQKSLFVDWADLYQFDPDLADDVRSQPGQLREYAEEALRRYDLPVDVSLSGAHVRLRGLPETTEIRDIRADHRGRLIAVRGIVRKATDVRPKITNAAFECQRCGTLTRIPQTSGDFQEPHECQGCERQGPFRVNFDQSAFVDAQKIRVQESPEGLRGGETPQAIDVGIEDDVTGEVTAGDHVTVTGILHLDQQGNDREKSPVFDVYMEGMAVEIEDEQFEEMDITDAEKERILELSETEDVYDRMVGAIAPSIFGYDDEKLAMVLQLFSGVTKHLPDGSRIRGDLHMLLIGDPGTGKCVSGDTLVTLADGSEIPIRELVEENLDDPKPVDDGVWDTAGFDVPALEDNGTVANRSATKVWKRESPANMYRLRTSTGKEIDVTPSHPLFVSRQGRFEPVRADTLEPGQFVATPRSTPHGTRCALDVDYRRSRSPNAVRLQLPDEWTPSLARLLGYIVAEGYVERNADNTGSVWITNNDAEVLEDVASALDDLGLPSTERSSHPGKPAREIYCSASEFVTFLENLEPALLERSADQRVPDRLFSADRETKANFLKAYLEGEGHVSASQREIAVASMSKELLEGVRSLLVSFGIASTIDPRQNGSYRLRISGQDFVAYVRKIGFVTERKATASTKFEDVPHNTNRDIVPGVSNVLQRVRESLALSQFDCGIPRTSYQHYERGDRNPSREALRSVVGAFEDRLEELRSMRASLEDGQWTGIEETRRKLNVSQARLADGMDVTQTAISYCERNGVAPDGGRVRDATEVVLDRIEEGLGVRSDIRALRDLVESDVRWERLESIEVVESDEEWVYDLEVEETHSYVSNGVVSHNSQLLQYIRNIAPRSVYTSGKGASTAGLCVTGDTLIHTAEGLVPIRDVAERYHPKPVDEDTAAAAEHGVYSFDGRDGAVDCRSSSHVWRMPEKPCRRVETTHGKELEASTTTPVLVCGTDGIEWRPIAEVEPGDHVAVPKYDGIDRRSPPIREFLEFTDEKLKPSPESVEFLRRRLREEFGTLRAAAAALDLSEGFIYDSLSNRHLPLEKLDRILDAVDANRCDLDFERAMLRHGDGIRIPDAFSADLLYLVGLVFGDGDVMVSRRGENRGQVRISNSDEDLLETAAEIIETTFDKSVAIEYQDDRVPCIRLHSATVARLFSNLGVESPKTDIGLDPRLTTAEHADAFLRGLFDADGSVSARAEGGSSIQFSTIDDRFAQQIQLMLETYGVRARLRERDRRGTYELDSGDEIESTSVQTHLTIYGKDVDAFADAIGFRSAEKSAALATITGDTRRRGERLPIGQTLLRADGGGSRYHTNVAKGSNPSRKRAKAMLDDRDLGGVEPIVEEVVEADLRWDEVDRVVDTGHKEVFDLTVPDTNNFVGNGIVAHNTAAAVRDDFGDGQQWTLEAGALVLADQGIAAVDELDKMNPDDRSALHEGLEQQQISISKAGINATLKARCSLLGAANPKYGRFDQYEPIGEQIDLEPALISRFDLIFTVTDEPDAEEDADMAEHIIRTNYAGELNTHREEITASNHGADEVEAATDTVAPTIDPELLRKYIAYAKRTCYPTMTDEAKAQIRDFYVDLRSRGADEDAPVPVTARKLEALVRLAEASARVRLSDTVEAEDAERATDIVLACLREIGMDPETGQFDADVVETGTSKSQRDRIRSLKHLIAEIEEEYDEGAPVEVVIERAEETGMDAEKAKHEIDQLKQKGEVYEPRTDHLRTT